MSGPLMHSVLQNGALVAICVVMIAIMYWLVVNHRAHMEHLRSSNADADKKIARIEQELRVRLEAAERELKFQRDRAVDFERRLCATLPDHPVVAKARGPAEQCPFCRSGIQEDEVVRCLTCETEHHTECYADHGRCAVFGCGGRASASGTRAEIRALA